MPLLHLDLTNQEIREALVALAQTVTIQINFIMVPWVVENTITSSMRVFVRMNPPIFLLLSGGGSTRFS